ncbi:MAG: hypothetical protein SCK28_02975, partial [Bacillota bacterium]|nr:hypothetical protein [Bacillota bacterium]
GVFGSMFISWLVVIPRLRRVAEKLGILTTSEYLALRYGQEKFKIISAFWTIIFIIPMIIIQFMGAGYLVESNMGISYTWGMILIASIVVISTQLSGYLGIAWLDTAQGILMTVGTVMMVIVSLRQVGGFSGLNEQLAAINPGLTEFTGFMPLSLQIGLIITFLISFWGQPHLTARVWGLKDATAVRTAFPLSMALGAIWAFGAGLIGLVAKVLYPGLASGDLAMPTMISGLPSIYSVLLFFTLIAAMMTSANSLLLAVAATIGNDLVGKVVKDLPEKTVLMIIKVSVLVIGVLSFVIAIKPPALILELNAFAFGGFALIFGIPLIIGVLWEKANAAGALVALSVSPIAYILWKIFLVSKTGIPEIVGALLVSVILILVMKVWGSPPSLEMEKIYRLSSNNSQDNKGVIM